MLDLTNWKLGLPTDTDGDGVPDQVKQPALSRFASPWFRPSPDGRSIDLSAPVGGAVQAGSMYPRSELREMRHGTEAAWDASAGVHTLTVGGRVNALPPVKPQMVIAQIHDATQAVTLVLADAKTVRGATVITVVHYAAWQPVHPDAGYAIGAPYAVRIVAADGAVSVFYNGACLVAELPITTAGLYFKAGAYVQSNPSRGDAPTAIGGVTLTELDVSHT